MQFNFGSYEWTWLKESGGEVPPSRDSHVVFAVHKRIYIFGGNSANALLNDLWEFDPTSVAYYSKALCRWRQVHPAGPVPAHRKAHSVAVIQNQHALIIGGKGLTAKLADLHVLDFIITHNDKATVADPQWRKCVETGDLPTARDGHSMCYSRTHVYLFGGEDNERRMFGDLLRGEVDVPLSPTSDCHCTWTRCALKSLPLRSPRPRRAATLNSCFDDYLILIGGEVYEAADTRTLCDVWIYNIPSDTWQELLQPGRPDAGDYLSPRAYHTSVVHEDKVYVFGGLAHANKILNDLWVLSLKGELPKPLLQSKPVVPSIISGKDGRAAMSSMRNVQYFVNYIQERPFPSADHPPVSEEDKHKGKDPDPVSERFPAPDTDREPEAKSKMQMQAQDIEGEEVGRCGNIAVSSDFGNELATAYGGWGFEAFAELIRVICTLTGNRDFDIRLQNVSDVQQEIKAAVGSDNTKPLGLPISKQTDTKERSYESMKDGKKEADTKQENEAHDSTELPESKGKEEGGMERAILSQFTDRMLESVRLRHDRGRAEAVVVITSTGIGMDADLFKEMFYYFGKKQGCGVDFGLFKLAALRVGRGFLLVSKSNGQVHVGLYSREYMRLIHSSTLYCPYVNFSLEREQGESLPASTTTTLDHIARHSGTAFETGHKLLEFVQQMRDGLVLFLLKLTESIHSPCELLSLENDIAISQKGITTPGHSLDTSLRTYVLYMTLRSELRLRVQGETLESENPYIMLEQYVVANKVKQWTRVFDHIFDDNDKCTGFLFHRNLFSLKELETFRHSNSSSPNISFNGILIYFQNKLHRRVLAPNLGDHVGLNRRMLSKKRKQTGVLFEWNGYVNVAGVARSDLRDTRIICGFEDRLQQYITEITVASLAATQLTT